MKYKYSFNQWLKKYALLVVAALVSIASPAQNAVVATNQSAPQSAVNSIYSSNGQINVSVASKLLFHNKQFCDELVAVLENRRSSGFQKTTAAIYLGQLRAAQAVDALAKNIKLDVDYPIDAARPKGWSFMVNALVEIGNPSIPAVIRNLAESDDAKVRELSLEVIERIDNDKDISALRLQKAIKAETDAQKQARLQNALKELEKL